MSQRDEQCLEDDIECLNYNFYRSNHSNLDKDILKTILIRGMKEGYFDLINLMGKGDISKGTYDTVASLCLRRCRGSGRSSFSAQDSSTMI